MTAAFGVLPPRGSLPSGQDHFFLNRGPWGFAREASAIILAGTEGPLRGVPVQIRYQPNWWFQAVLNLAPGNPAPRSPARASR